MKKSSTAGNAKPKGQKKKAHARHRSAKGSKVGPMAVGGKSVKARHAGKTKHRRQPAAKKGSC